MNFEEQNAGAIREISFLLRGRKPKMIAMVARIVRTVVEDTDDPTDEIEDA